MNRKMQNGNRAGSASLVVLLVSVFLLSALAGVPFVGEVSAAGPYDWPMFRHDLQNTGYSASPAPNTNQTLWNYTTGTGGFVTSSPAVVGGKVYVGSFDKNVHCLDAATGAKIWNYTTGGNVHSSPAVADGKVYACSYDRNVYCLSALTGAFIWNYTTGDELHGSPTVADGTVYIASNDTRIYALNASTGALVWNFKTGRESHSSPAVADGKVYIGSNDGKLYCLNAITGASIWNYTTGAAVESSPTVVDGKVYVGSFDDQVYCLDAATGAKIWNYTTSGDVQSSPTVVDGRVYVGSFDNKVYCLNALTGAFMWNYTTGNDVFSSPAVADGKVYVGSFDNSVHCLNAADGALIWSYATGGDVYSSAAVANGVVYIGSVDRKVYAFSSSPPISASMWSKTYGGTGNEVGTGETVQTNDGGYAISGYTNSSGAGGTDFWLFKTDGGGNMLWNKTYGGALNEVCEDMCQTNDGGYALTGHTYSFGAGGQDFYLVKTDANGVMQWNKTYGGTGDEYAIHLEQTSDGGYALYGDTESFGAGNSDAWLVKTDASGVMQWNRTYGGNGTEVEMAGMLQTSDGGYLLTGSTNSFGTGSPDVWLVKTDVSGNVQWNKTYGGNSVDRGYDLIRSSDGGYAVVGYTMSFGGMKVYLVKTDAAGVMQWNKTYGGTMELGLHGIQTADGGYAIVGWNYQNGQDLILIKTDSAGGMLWKQIYGGTGLENGYALLQTGDGGYALTGTTTSSGAGGYDVWLVKTDASGVVPESLTFALVMLLSSIAALIGTLYFRKPPRITK